MDQILLLAEQPRLEVVVVLTPPLVFTMVRLVVQAVVPVLLCMTLPLKLLKQELVERELLGREITVVILQLLIQQLLTGVVLAVVVLAVLVQTALEMLLLLVVQV
jgi:hypothetical protein